MAIMTAGDTVACTSAIIGAGRSATRHTLMWKHRDTGAPYNYIARHEATDSTIEYIALHNSSDIMGLEAWIGMNRAGLAIMNTASYNLAPDTATVKDREGFVMTLALQRCHTVADFATLLDTLPRPLGVQANFGVLDATGTAAYFETCDTGYKIYNVADSDAIIRTNYSHSGGMQNRLGVAREQTASRLLTPKACISKESMLDTLSRHFINPATGIDLEITGDSIAIDNGDYIPRYISTASIAIEAVPSPAADGSAYIMWTQLGYPPCADEHMVSFDNIPGEVKPDADGITPAERKADSRKARMYDGRRKGKNRIVKLIETR